MNPVVFFRLIRYYRRCGYTWRRALSRAWKVGNETMLDAIGSVIWFLLIIALYLLVCGDPSLLDLLHQALIRKMSGQD